MSGQANKYITHTEKVYNYRLKSSKDVSDFINDRQGNVFYERLDARSENHILSTRSSVDNVGPTKVKIEK